ncbi:MAG: hypothetical protein METHAR1v1_1340011 [Methanothrix sp.]|nr:MAG: hypothetical protein METHAR1v1_1340011 [Methanothrix sp.]
MEPENGPEAERGLGVEEERGV